MANSAPIVRYRLVDSGHTLLVLFSWRERAYSVMEVAGWLLSRIDPRIRTKYSRGCVYKLRKHAVRQAVSSGDGVLCQRFSKKILSTGIDLSFPVRRLIVRWLQFGPAWANVGLSRNPGSEARIQARFHEFGCSGQCIAIDCNRPRTRASHARGTRSTTIAGDSSSEYGER